MFWSLAGDLLAVPIKSQPLSHKPEPVQYQDT